jgi:hypothetical protein
MPSEYRQILFSNRELIDALYEYDRAAQTKLLQGDILSCTPVGEDKVAVRLQLMNLASGEDQVASLSSELVAAVLLRYCIKHRIPIPKNATKSIQIHDDQISLDVRIKGRAMPAAPMAAAAVDAAPQDGKRET